MWNYTVIEDLGKISGINSGKISGKFRVKISSGQADLSSKFPSQSARLDFKYCSGFGSRFWSRTAWKNGIISIFDRIYRAGSSGTNGDQWLWKSVSVVIDLGSQICRSQYVFKEGIIILNKEKVRSIHQILRRWAYLAFEKSIVSPEKSANGWKCGKTANFENFRVFDPVWPLQSGESGLFENLKHF